MKKRYAFSFAAILILLFLLILINLLTGSVRVTFRDLSALFSGSGNNETIARVLLDIRLPRILAALLLGGALSVSGFLLQTFFANPIAGPFVLGISSGAKLCVAMTMICFLDAGIAISSVGMVAAAFFGSLLAMTIVLALSLKVRNMSVLVVCGILIGYICSAVTDFFVTFASDSNIVNLHNWSLGSFSGTGWNDILIMSVLIFAALVFSIFLSKPIGAFQLGENYARNMGVNIRALRIALIILSTLLAGCVTAFAGPISFVGIAVPHLLKSLTKTAKPLVLIPGCFLGGGAITLFCDGIARSVFAPTELSISTVTAFFLVPVVISMMVRKNGGGSNA